LEVGEFGLHEFTDAYQAIMEIGSRHPLRREQALEIENAFSAPGTVEKMCKEDKLVCVDFKGKEYLLPSYFIRGK